jgi:hypothetical protein
MQPYFTIQTFVINLFRNGYISNITNFQCENERRELEGKLFMKK